MILAARGIEKRFGGVAALDGVDLELPAGEVLGLIGPNGSGKTTMINCISGALAVDAGEIELDGQPLTDVGRARRAKAGIARTFQNLKLFIGMTAQENVEIGLTASTLNAREGAEELEYWIDRLRLQDVRRDTVSNLPYGYQRRVELARAMVARPKVLLLDEPAAGLNDAETAELLEIIVAINKEFDCSVVLIDHDMSLVVEASDRILVLDEGRVIWSGDPHEVFDQKVVVEAYLGEVS